jgi:hypothetical protein
MVLVADVSAPHEWRHRPQRERSMQVREMDNDN